MGKKSKDEGNEEVKNKTEKPEKEQTEEEKRETASRKLVLTLYEDGHVKVEALQNVTNRSQAEFIIHKAFTEYQKRDIASVTAATILDSIAKAQDKKRIHVPGK